MRVIAFYLPQFHPTAENDRWWGRGFTEWRNVVRAKPLFPQHYQPHLPADLGFYDLRLPETRAAQAEMARRYGITGFCYYHYWFEGTRLLERPFSDVLRSGEPDFPFCLCWANENWTRQWDGMANQVLMPQRYSLEDDRAHIDYLIEAFQDPRYIKIDDRPLFLVYRTELFPEPSRTTEIWRERARAAGFPDLYLARLEARVSPGPDPRNTGFDAAVEFAPDKSVLAGPIMRGEYWGVRTRILNQLSKVGLISSAYFEHAIYTYDSLVEGMLRKSAPDFLRFRCVTPGWDNSPRREKGAIIFHRSTPQRYETWLSAVARETLERHKGEERVIFVNAWNEWAEGNHLEPDQLWGLSYLEATALALKTKEPMDQSHP
jgi:lipopolysaccharide biosynthesis protein